MKNQNKTEERDEVLFAFQQACSRPTVEEIIQWTESYPQFAEDIRAHAAVAREWADGEGEVVAGPDESLLANAYSRALNVVYKAETTAVPSSAPSAARTFQEIMAARGTTVRQLASAVGIKRGIIADLVTGRMSGPIRLIFIGAVSSALNIARDVFDDAHRRALAAPILGPAKADHAPTIVVRAYEEIIRTCDELTDEEKLHWLQGG